MASLAQQEDWKQWVLLALHSSYWLPLIQPGCLAPDIVPLKQGFGNQTKGMRRLKISPLCSSQASLPLFPRALID